MLLLSSFTSLAEIPAFFSERSIILRQKKQFFHQPFLEAAILTLVDLPVTFFGIVAYTSIVYFMAGLQASVGSFS